MGASSPQFFSLWGEFLMSKTLSTILTNSTGSSQYNNGSKLVTLRGDRCEQGFHNNYTSTTSSSTLYGSLGFNCDSTNIFYHMIFDSTKGLSPITKLKFYLKFTGGGKNDTKILTFHSTNGDPSNSNTANDVVIATHNTSPTVAFNNNYSFETTASGLLNFVRDTSSFYSSGTRRRVIFRLRNGEKECEYGTAPNTYTRNYLTIGVGSSYSYTKLEIFYTAQEIKYTDPKFGFTYTTGTVPKYSNYTIPSSYAPSRTGYTFSGWSDGTTTYRPGASISSVSKDITLTAVWTPITYTVSYNLNGGGGTKPANQSKEHDTPLTLRSTSGITAKASGTATGYRITLNANGGSVSSTYVNAVDTLVYRVLGWNTKADGSGTSYSSGGSYTTNAGATMYVRWGSSQVDGPVTLPIPTRTGYKFEGWYTSVSGGEKRESGYVPSTTETLYAHWEPNTYTFTFNDSKQGITIISGEYDSTITLPTPGSAVETGSSTTLYHTLNNSSIISDESRSTKKTLKTTYPFNGWLYNNTLYAGDYPQTVDGDRTYTASYGSGSTSYEYTLFQLPKYEDKKESSIITTTLNYGYNDISETVQTEKIFTYSHTNWTDSYGYPYNAEAYVQPTSGTTYTSNWTSTISYGAITLPELSREGYNFLGWFTEQGEIIANDYTPTTDTTIYAHWEVANFITTVTRYISNSASDAKKCEVYYCDENKNWIPIEEIKYYNGSSWVQVGEQIPYTED